MENKASKVLVTVIAVVIFFVLFAVVVGLRGEAGYQTPGMLGLILGFGLIGALKAVWKKDNGQNKDNNEIEKK